MEIISVRYKRLELGLVALITIALAFFPIVMAIFPEAFQNYHGRGSGWLHLLLTPIGRWLVLPLGAIALIYTGLAAFVRAIGREKAIEVRASGLVISSLYSTRSISWPEFDRVEIETYRADKKSKPTHNLIFYVFQNSFSKPERMRIPLSLTDTPDEGIDPLLLAIHHFKSASLARRQPRDGRGNAGATSAVSKFGRKVN